MLRMNEWMKENFAYFDRFGQKNQSGMQILFFYRLLSIAKKLSSRAVPYRECLQDGWSFFYKKG